MQTIVDGWPSKWVYGPDDSYLATASGKNLGDWNEVMANAHLIAAAPDLLAACEHVRDTIREFLPTVMSEDLTAIEAAIAKAKGKA